MSRSLLIFQAMFFSLTYHTSDFERGLPISLGNTLSLVTWWWYLISALTCGL